MMTNQPKKLYKLVHNETGTVTWCTDSDEIYYLSDWYEGQDYSIYEYELVDEW